MDINNKSIFIDEQTLKANLEFISYVIIHARRLAYDEVSYEQIADLMDVVHNLPKGLLNWGKWDQDRFLSFLKMYDEKWPNKLKKNALINIYRKY
ncbi:MAG: hypothetical protein U9P73_06635 [Candidatus Cloacimonadota bacterium]|nr:hypothetical protein [Candidatus Cloacimonadota bacterium]